LTGGSASYAYATNADGSVVVGAADKAQFGVYFPFRWTSGGMVQIPLAATETSGTASGVSDDGSVVVGSVRASGGDIAYRWQVGHATVTQLGTNGTASSRARGVSGNGLVVVGGDANSAFRWTSGTGFVAIANALGASSSFATAANVDGTVVVGSSNLGTWVWDTVNGVRLIKQVVIDLGVSLTGYDLRTVYALSSDGKTLVGGTSTPTGIDRSYVVRLP
jgi:uncharacterized membrane protein